MPKPNPLVASIEVTAEPLKTIGEMHACGPRANYHTFDLSDGTRISQSCEGHTSPTAANLALRRRLATITDIIERTPIFDENGRRVGDKVVASNGSVVELEAAGKSLCSKTAASLEHLQWFERR